MVRRKKELPADFIEVAQSLRWGWVAIRKHYVLGDATLARFMKLPEVLAARPEFVGRVYYREVAPADFAERARVMTIKQLCAHYGVCNKKLLRWRKETGVNPVSAINPVGKTPMRPMPADFATLAPTMTFNAIRVHWGCGDSVARRWLLQAGVSPKKCIAKPRVYVSKRKNAAGGNVRSIFTGYVGPRRSDVTGLNKAKSVHDDAADVLRKYGPCYRCGPTGLLSDRGEFWRYGNSIMTPDELLVKADRYRAKAA